MEVRKGITTYKEFVKMPPESKTNEDFISHDTNAIKAEQKPSPKDADKITPRHEEIVWESVVVFSLLHVAMLYGLYILLFQAKVATVLFATFIGYISGFGVNAGTHRLWCHRAYKATMPLKLILLFLQTMAFQRSVIWWCRDHRTHHKFSETHADPHNATRGFFFAHIGWLLCRKHQDLIDKGRAIDVSDLREEAILRFQDKYYLILMPIICFLIPTAIPMLLWKETLLNAFMANIFRWVGELNLTFLVNSAAHLWGSNRPYDKEIYPTEIPILSLFTFGEGWHNFHHTFPWDYRASEFSKFNGTLQLINFFAKIGWAYDLRTASDEMIKSRVNRTGDGTREWLLLKEKGY